MKNDIAAIPRLKETDNLINNKRDFDSMILIIECRRKLNIMHFNIPFTPRIEKSDDHYFAFNDD